MDEVGREILKARYLHDGESPSDLYQRVAWNVLLAGWAADIARSLCMDKNEDVARQRLVVDRRGLFDSVVTARHGTPTVAYELMNYGVSMREAGIHLKTAFHAFTWYALADQFYWAISKGDSMEAFYDLRAEVDALVWLMSEGTFLPNSPTLMNAGRDLQQLSACFVLPVEDSLDGIFDAVKNAALIHKSGGGTGFSFSKLRPEGSFVASTGGVASGPVSFMEVFDAATGAIKQGGVRRGANMAVLHCEHPDILKFVTAKRDKTKLTNFNLSVAVTDRFMDAVRANQGYEAEDGRFIDAPAIMAEIVHGAWADGEPGIIFIDAMNRANPTPELGQFEATNPCGEQPLLPYESCNLGSINLAAMERNAIPFTSVVERAANFLDKVIDANVYPLHAVEVATKRTRKIGLGVMGWADYLALRGIPYDSEDALLEAELIMETIRTSALEVCRGRNATVTTIAPTGSLSLIAGCNGGIEPFYALSYDRRALDGRVFRIVNPTFVEVAKREGFYTDEIADRVAATGSVQNIPEVPEKWRAVFKTAYEITPEWHVRMQAAFQKFTDNAVSKTINLPKDATKQDVLGAFTLAYDLGCKGITVYRDGSRAEQVMSRPSEHRSQSPAPRPPVLNGKTVKRETPLGNLYVTVNLLDGRPFELFAQIGRAGSDVAAFTEALARLVSLALRCGINASEVVQQLIGIGGNGSIGFGPNRVRSVPDAVAQVLASVIADCPSTVEDQDICPSCGEASLVRVEGCLKCVSCGYSQC